MLMVMMYSCFCGRPYVVSVANEYAESTWHERAGSVAAALDAGHVDASSTAAFFCDDCGMLHMRPSRSPRHTVRLDLGGRLPYELSLN